MEEKRTSGAWIMVAVLLLLPVLYVGSYMLMLEGPRAVGGPHYWPQYRLDSGYIRDFYSPINKLDRHVRPKYWKRDF
jgi:hypothetical protein